MRDSKKRLILIILTVILFSGCKKLYKKIFLPSVKEIMTKHITAQKEVTTWRTEVTIEIDIETKNWGDGRLSTSTNTTGTVDMGRRKMLLKTISSIPLSGKTEEVKTETYLINTTQYTKANQVGIKIKWKKQELGDFEAEKIWESMTGFFTTEDLTPAIEEGHTTLQGIEQVDGVFCYLLNASIVDKDSLQLRQLLTHQKIGGFKGLPFTFSEDFRDIKLAYWIDKNSYRVIQSKITANLAVEIMGKKLEGKLKNITRFFDYGQELSIPLPENI